MFSNAKFEAYGWQGLVPPSYILANRKFLGVVLDPPDFNPGSWIGGSSVLLDHDSGEFWLTARPRKQPPLRGYATEIYKSLDGENYAKAASVTSEDLKTMSGQNVVSIEAQQLIKDPGTGRYHLYVSADTRGTEQVDGEWDTFLLISDNPAGPYEFHGLAWKRGNSFDSHEARDAAIGIVDGKYLALYKAAHGSEEEGRVNVALATSIDGIKWTKHGTFKVDGKEQPRYMQLYGNIFAGTVGPVFMGLCRRYLIRKASLAKDFEAYIINYRDMNLEPLFKDEWKPLSPYEREDYPTHGYMNIIHDPFKNRLLMYVESIDPHYTKEIGWRTQVDRLILYETKL
ncbi:MAG: hypothetical protein NWF14_09820, partial [Candidatus Bathyarchaeota archaeon]|nr:hypothetical protein [Candidatus Bathyarchaeota archaeon]